MAGIGARARSRDRNGVPLSKARTWAVIDGREELHTVAECIHGFEDGFCDICFPRQQPEPVAVAAKSTTRAAPRVATVQTRRLTNAPTAPVLPRVPPFSTRRLYHVTHVRNFEAILLDRAIKSPNAGAAPDVDVTAPVVRELRAAAHVEDERTVADHVPFYLSPDAERWLELRDGAVGAHWSTAARLSSPTEYVMLVAGTTGIGPDVAVADTDASAPASRITVGDPARTVARLTREDPALSTVELLVPEQVPLDSLVLIGVPNEPMRTTVRAMIDAAGWDGPRIVVHPPWFAPTDG